MPGVDAAMPYVQWQPTESFYAKMVTFHSRKHELETLGFKISKFLMPKYSMPEPVGYILGIPFEETDAVKEITLGVIGPP